MTRPATKHFALASLLVFAFGAFGCKEDAAPTVEKQYSFTLEVDVTDAQDNPLPKVPVTVDEKVVGHTDKDGKFTAILEDFANKPVTLGVVAPDGFRFAPDTDSVTEMLKVTSVNGQESGVPVFLNAVADSLKKDYFVWVKAACNNGCDDWPVLLDGEEVARTNALGFAHFSFTDEPGREVELEVVTTAPYTPSNPKYTLLLDLDSTVYRVEQPFNDPTRKVRAAAPKGRKKGGKKGGKKTGKAEEKADPNAFVPIKQEKDDEYNGIQLF